MSGRKEPRLFVTPAPGDYEHETKKSATEVHNEKIRETKRMSSRQPRFLDTLYRRKIRENFPAPNRYKVNGCFDKFFKIHCKCDPYASEPPPFGRTAKRFDDKTDSDIPGPGTYDPLNRLKCTTSIYQAPLGAIAGRFKKVPEDTGPGPSDYHSNVGNLAYESYKRFKYSYSKSIQPQMYFAAISSYDDEEDFSDICSPKKGEEIKSSVYHAAFKSRTERFPKPEKTDIPDPGTYEDLTAFKANRDKCNFLCRRLAPPFGTRSHRVLFKIKMDTPDPTSYNLATDISQNVKGGTIAESERPEDVTRKPGPAHYCIHPYLSSSVLKKSFNVALGEPKVIADLTKQEKPKGSCQPCTRKKLRWFAMSVHEYNRCHTI